MFTTFAAQRINGAVLNELADLTELRFAAYDAKKFCKSPKLNLRQATKSNLKPEVHALLASVSRQPVRWL